MKTTNNNSNVQPVESTEKRGPGRPPAMPGQEMKNHMVRVAVDVPDLIGDLAKARGISRGELVTLLVRQASQKRAKDQARRSSKAVAKVKSKEVVTS
jgi:hypothetical protein